ncbi:MAG TPA: methyltransferase domain-containing protein [Planctomycetota bacterium]|nr:methyltransferase domain-containing protein [Planctomycetota bacterium]
MPELFACPSCRGALTREIDRLRCGCSTWPVVEEIPIFAPWARNRSFALEDILVRHLPPPPGLVGRVLRRVLPPVGAIQKAVFDREATFLALAAALGRTRDLDYFRYRFSDLSYLTTAALLTPLLRGPVLDLGCGAGHMVHALFRRIPRSMVVGLDLNFTLLYLAKRFVAPSALYVCADASARLPFLDGAFTASLCADTFKYLADRSTAAGELLRVTSGPIIVSHFYDPSFQGEGVPAPLEPEACAALFSSRSPRLYREQEILQGFLERRELDLRSPGASKDDVTSLTAGVEPRVYPGADYFVSGTALNPVYEVREEGETLHLRRRFISERYTEAYRKVEKYLPESLTVTKEQVASGDPELVRKFVLLELPDNYS